MLFTRVSRHSGIRTSLPARLRSPTRKASCSRPALLIAMVDPSPSFQLVDGYTFGLLALGGFSILFFFRDKGWHPAGAIVAALAFAFGASAAWRVQHVGQVQSFAFFALALWLVARTLDRNSVRWGIAAGVASALMIVEPDQVAYLGALRSDRLCDPSLARGRKPRGAYARDLPPTACGWHHVRPALRAATVAHDPVRSLVEPVEHPLCRSHAWLVAPGIASHARLQRPLWRLRQGRRVLGALQLDVGIQRGDALAEYEPALYRRLAGRPAAGPRPLPALAAGARDPVFHVRCRAHGSLRARIEHTVLQAHLRSVAGRRALSPTRRCDFPRRRDARDPERVSRASLDDEYRTRLA
jgi:hypothetical protein